MLKFFSALALGVLALVTPANAAGPAPEYDQRVFEVRFLYSMIDHHYEAVRVAELFAGRVTHPELQAMGDQMRTAQLAEIEIMKTWLQTWYGQTHHPHINARMQRRLDYYATLSGADFERHVMAFLVRHHSQAVRAGLDCLNQAYNPEMLDMCAMMLGMQGDEIAQLRLWLQIWYAIGDLDPYDRP